MRIIAAVVGNLARAVACCFALGKAQTLTNYFRTSNVRCNADARFYKLRES